MEAILRIFPFCPEKDYFMTDLIQRDSRGRFVSTNAGGPGRPRIEIEQEYLMTMDQAVSGEAWQAIVERATLDAENGDARAREWLSSYLLGMPISKNSAGSEESPSPKES
ncbi:MAG: hypothetical protein NT075_23745 [Chloroflexi bacterium]|nr:hypothetical protein [Chloroflexota bacterium]